MSLHALRFDKTKFYTDPQWCEIDTDDVAAFLKREAPGPAVYLLDESALERLLLAATAQSPAAPAIEDCGRQNVTETPEGKQTTPLAQIIKRKSGKRKGGNIGLRGAYVDAGRVPGAVRRCLDRIHKDDPSRRSFFFVSVMRRQSTRVRSAIWVSRSASAIGPTAPTTTGAWSTSKRPAGSRPAILTPSPRSPAR